MALTHSVTYTCEPGWMAAWDFILILTSIVVFSPVIPKSTDHCIFTLPVSFLPVFPVAPVRLHESAASLIFCQADLAAKHEGVRTRAAVRHPTFLHPCRFCPVCLSVFLNPPACLSVCLYNQSVCQSVILQLDGHSMALTAAAAWLQRGFSTHPCSLKMLWMKASITWVTIQSPSICLPAGCPCGCACLSSFLTLCPFHLCIKTLVGVSAS